MLRAMLRAGGPVHAVAVSVALLLLVATVHAAPGEVVVDHFLADRQSRDSIPGLAVARAKLVQPDGTIKWPRPT